MRKRPGLILITPINFFAHLLGYYITGGNAEFTISSVASSMISNRPAGRRGFACHDTLRTSRDRPAGHGCRPALKATRSGTGGPFSVIAVCNDTAFLSGLPWRRRRSQGGTWSRSTEIDRPIINRISFAHNIANEGGYGGRHRLIRNLMGTWLIQELRADFRRQGRDYSYEELSAAAAQAAPFAYLIDVDDELFYAPGDMAAKIRQRCRERLGRAPESAESWSAAPVKAWL